LKIWRIFDIVTFQSVFEINLGCGSQDHGRCRQASLVFNLNQQSSQKTPRSSPVFRIIETVLLAVLLLNCFSPLLYADSFTSGMGSNKAYTIMLYLNGDNNLTHEVLHTVDMLETVGSSDDMNILVLVDGRPGGDHGYGPGWDGSKLLYITHDSRIGEINSLVLQDMGEQNLGEPETLASFIKQGLGYPADRYVFGTFAHGRGVIDTQTIAAPEPQKSLAISPDETDGSMMTLQDFRHAVQRGLNGKKFDAMVFFSCLTGMVEVGYALKDLTKYLIVSEDEIRIVNNPPGSFQIRGIKFEEPLKAIRSNPDLSIYDFGKITIDTFIEQYSREVTLKDSHQRPYTCRYPAALALIESQALDQLAGHLNKLAGYINDRLRASDDSTMLLNEIQSALSKTQRYSSFMNLEYYDLQDFIQNLAGKTRDQRLTASCLAVVDFMVNKVVVYEKHTPDSASNGLSIFLSNYLIPDNIFRSHQKMYQKSKFCQDTSWDEMIELIRIQMRLKSE